ncbi:gluconokinase [Rhodococcus sp. HNM0569]|uniref:gluconokinase n=1 Tax=Rhodococcus sp. HNM0569 TaxID=2716340 RepID=UPI00146B75E5|nr:gluconokinase [Rhodococcus sp. HNM0569]NLU84623.1 gluconokinase [Rhodococcus sp. HNM0569]
MSEQQLPVLVVMGVSGAGKSTIAGLVAEATGWDLLEGDDLHPKSNVEKMAAGHPLTDDDRWPWLRAIAGWIAEHTDRGEPGIVTCSALKRSYRDILRGEHVLFVYLESSHDTLESRLAARKHHYMPASLLGSQLDTLEPPGPDERALTVDADRQPREIADEVLVKVESRAV